MTNSKPLPDKHYLPLTGQELRFWQNGSFRAGEQETKIALGTQMVALMPSLRAGWIRWKLNWEEDFCPAGMIWGLIASGFEVPSREELGDHDPARWEYADRDPWPLHMLAFVDVKSGKPFTFVGSTPPELKALADLSHAYGRRIHTDRRVLPIVELRTESKQRGMLKIHRPKFETVGWTYPPGRRLSPQPKTDAPSLLKTE